MLVFLQFRIVAGLRTSRWFGAWVCLEINLLCFVCWLGLNEARGRGGPLKYFVVQSLGSGLLLAGVLFSSMQTSVAWFLFISSLLLKLGAAPLQGWLISLVGYLSWPSIFLLRSVQKILPTYFFFLLSQGPLFLIARIGALVGVLGGVLQISLKKIFGYSSVLAARWLLRSHGWHPALIYLGAYASAFFILCKLFHGYGWERESQVNRLALSRGALISYFVILLRIAGIPPMLGFYAKLGVLVSLVARKGGLIIVALLRGSAGFLYVYVRLGLNLLGLGRQSLRGEQNTQVGNLRLAAGLLLLRLVVWVYMWK